MVRSSPRASAGLRMLAASFCPACAARADHGVGFIDKEDDRSGRRLHLFDQSLEPIFEFALDARARLQQRQIERADGDVAQARGHVALHDAHGEAFHHGGLADTRLTGEDGVVLPAPGENVDHLADFEIAAQHRIDLAVARVLGEVDGVLIEMLGLAAAGLAPPGAPPAGAATSSASSVYSRESARIAGSTLRSASGSILRSSLLKS